MWPFPARLPGTPAWSTPIAEAPLLAVDFETTGLDPRKDRIVSIGWIPVDGLTIDLSGAGYLVVAGGEVGDSATIHQLTDDVVTAGVSPEEAYHQLMGALQGRMMLAHFAEIEVNFLAALHRRVTGQRVSIPSLDTLAIERRHMERVSQYPRGDDLRLARVRQRFGLPAYANHNALTDALACAELYLAQMGRETEVRARALADLRY